MDRFYETLGYIFIFLILWFGLMKGVDFYTHYTMIKEREEKVKFLEKNNASVSDKCIAIKDGIDFAINFQDQKALDSFKQKFEVLECSILGY